MQNESSTASVAHRGSNVVRRALELLGATIPSQDFTVEPSPDSQKLETLGTIAENAGLRAMRFAAPPLAVFSDYSNQQPILTLDASHEPILLQESRGSRICIEDEHQQKSWVDVEQLTQILGLEHAGVEHPFLSLENLENTSIQLGTASPWENVIALLKTERSNIGAITVYAMGVGLMSLALPLAVQMVVNTVAFGQAVQPLLLLTLLLGGGLAFGAILRGLQAWTVEVVQRRLFIKLVSELAERLPRVHVKAFELGSGPELVNRFFDVFTAQKAVASLLLDGIEALLTVLVGLILLAFYHPLLLGFGFVLLCCTYVVFIVLGRGATRTTIAESKAKYAIAGWLEEMVRHLFALKMAGGSEYARRRLDNLAVDWLRYRSQHFRIFYQQYLGALILQVATHASLLALGGWLVIERQLTLGQLVAAELVVTAVVGSLSKLGGKLDAVYDLVAAADKLGALLGLQTEENRDSGLPFSRPLEHPARVELRKVSSAGGELRDFSLTIEAGTIIAVHGERQSSAVIADLLFGLRLPTKGSIFIDDHDLKDLRLETLRSRVAVVREPELLPGTIADNIRAAGRSVYASEIWQILETTGLADTIRELPKGLRTEILPSGAPLDRLGALRLTLARTLAAHPSLLILDGLIDALPEYERPTLLEKLNQERTVIVLTHELAVADHCKTCVEFTVDIAARNENLS
ncbi:MAG: ATP-binding cassette domain-containing protein [Myxococcales bacterium]|nr:ATP-binding cassette domain-containing protein [Myxococcales bacterium]